MSDLTVYTNPTSLAEAQQVAKIVLDSQFSRAFGVRTVQDAIVIMATGAELGMSALQSLRNIHSVKGRPTLSAALMVALCKKSERCEYFQLKESTPTVATYEARAKGDPTPTVLTYTLEDAKRAGLLGSEAWKKHPAAMLRARASSALARAVFPELVAGLYDPDELSEGEPTIGAAVTPSLGALSALPEWAQRAALVQVRRESFETLLIGIDGVGDGWASKLHAIYGANNYSDLHDAILARPERPKGMRKDAWLPIFNRLREWLGKPTVDAIPEPVEPVVPQDVPVDDGSSLHAEIQSLDEERVVACGPPYWIQRFGDFATLEDPGAIAKACWGDMLRGIKALGYAPDKHVLSERLQEILAGEREYPTPREVAALAAMHVAECVGAVGRSK